MGRQTGPARVDTHRRRTTAKRASARNDAHEESRHNYHVNRLRATLIHAAPSSKVLLLLLLLLPGALLVVPLWAWWIDRQNAKAF